MPNSGMQFISQKFGIVTLKSFSVMKLEMILKYGLVRQMSITFETNSGVDVMYT